MPCCLWSWVAMHPLCRSCAVLGLQGRGGAVGTPPRVGESTTSPYAQSVNQCLLGWMLPKGSLLKASRLCTCLAFAQYLCIFCNKKAVCSVHHTDALSVPRWWLCLILTGATKHGERVSRKPPFPQITSLKLVQEPCHLPSRRNK